MQTAFTGCSPRAGQCKHSPYWRGSTAARQPPFARAVALRPEVLLMDEPAAALDPISTSKIEDLIVELKKSYTIVIVTHNLQQAARVSEYCAFFLQGHIMESGTSMQMFLTPAKKETEDFITGRFG